MTERAYLVEVGARARAARVRSRMSQDQFAARAGIWRVSLGGIERGEHAAGVLAYLKIARVLGVPMGDLLDEEVS
jgi:transcriptional regulator with XRE-family HTH domain